MRAHAGVGAAPEWQVVQRSCAVSAHETKPRFDPLRVDPAARPRTAWTKQTPPPQGRTHRMHYGIPFIRWDSQGLAKNFKKMKFGYLE